MKKMYFIAIYPDQKTIDEVRVFKEDLALHFGNSKALKNDAHITLLPPFEREIELEEDIHLAFQKIDTNITPFEIILNGFGNFPNPKNPVLFIKPEESENLKQLYFNVKEKFSFKRDSFSPHVTVGYRDLTYENFLKAWEIYKGKNYETKFLVDKIILLRHDGKWIPINEKKLSEE
ncbi:2'-5' RNA ligase family protein [Chryseobacterium sp. 5_R23647]|uniref:2'-5' RNA ligase family protein n=1 Tax=Chryseobacterium sp. 5_R23647 TaxID=2258964 RepID=UPI000E27351D|nr:2'-5' RNA ligase family protein [Chryseobacterium sp. 5_R23647]REC43871.1 RNA 2',3'-cyclic phosphodiesterase [Chryseobacterium sp. 5_R23647]